MASQRRQTSGEALTDRPEFPLAAAPIKLAHDNRGFRHSDRGQGKAGDAFAGLAIAQLQPHRAQRRERLADCGIQGQGNRHLGNGLWQRGEPHRKPSPFRFQGQAAIRQRRLIVKDKIAVAAHPALLGQRKGAGVQRPGAIGRLPVQFQFDALETGRLLAE